MPQKCSGCGAELPEGSRFGTCAPCLLAIGLNAGVTHEYRSGETFPSELSATEVSKTLGYRTISTLLEIRILTATISWQFRNVLGERYQQFPGFAMPRQTNFYGVRWFFSN